MTHKTPRARGFLYSAFRASVRFGTSSEAKRRINEIKMGYTECTYIYTYTTHRELNEIEENEIGSLIINRLKYDESSNVSTLH